ncbi:hypothetical protein GGI43DRAFT_397492 [Trichoderma evansii]
MARITAHNIQLGKSASFTYTVILDTPAHIIYAWIVRQEKVILHPFSFCLFNVPSIETSFSLSAQPFRSATHHIANSTCSMCFSSCFAVQTMRTILQATLFWFSCFFPSLPWLFLFSHSQTGRVTTYEIMPPLLSPFMNEPETGSPKVKPVWHIPNFPICISQTLFRSH